MTTPTLSTLTPFEETREALFGFVSNTLHLGPEHVVSGENGTQVLAVTGLGSTHNEGLAIEAQPDGEAFVLTFLFRDGNSGDVDVKPFLATNDTEGLGLLFCSLVLGDFATADLILSIMSQHCSGDCEHCDKQE